MRAPGGPVLGARGLRSGSLRRPAPRRPGRGRSGGRPGPRPGRGRTHLQAAQVGGRHVARLPAARPRRQPPVRAAALQHQERLARRERQRVGLRRAERVQRAVHGAGPRRAGRGGGGGGGTGTQAASNAGRPVTHAARARTPLAPPRGGHARRRRAPWRPGRLSPRGPRRGLSTSRSLSPRAPAPPGSPPPQPPAPPRASPSALAPKERSDGRPGRSGSHPTGRTATSRARSLCWPLCSDTWPGGARSQAYGSSGSSWGGSPGHHRARVAVGSESEAGLRNQPGW